MNELIRKRGFKLGAVAEAIDVDPSTMSRWTDTAPIDKLFGISRFTGIDILEVIDCFNPDRPDTDLGSSPDPEHN